jgi:hypothetical protein
VFRTAESTERNGEPGGPHRSVAAGRYGRVEAATARRSLQEELPVVVIVVLLALLLLLLWLFGRGGGGGGGRGWGRLGPEGPDDGLAAEPERERSEVR